MLRRNRRIDDEDDEAIPPKVAIESLEPEEDDGGWAEVEDLEDREDPEDVEYVEVLDEQDDGDLAPLHMEQRPEPPPRRRAPLRSAPLRSGPPPRSAPLRAAPTPEDGLSSEIQHVVSDTVGRMLSNAFVELELEPDALHQLREQSTIAKLLAAVARIEQQTAQLDGVTRQLQALTAAVDELSDSTRALLRHQWDNMPPPNFWVRVQRADDEVRRSVDELAAEVRGRLGRGR